HVVAPAFRRPFPFHLLMAEMVASEPDVDCRSVAPCRAANHLPLIPPIPFAASSANSTSAQSRRETLGSYAKTSALNGARDGRYVGPGRQAHFAAPEIDGNRRGTRTGGGARDGLDAAVTVHAGDLEYEFLRHVI